MDASLGGAWKNGLTIKVIISINFLLLAVALMLDKAGGRSVDAALRASGMDNTVVWCVQVWMAGSTLLATGMFVWELVKKLREGDLPRRTGTALAVDGVFLLAWWLTLGVLCVYGFMLGMAA